MKILWVLIFVMVIFAGGCSSVSIKSNKDDKNYIAANGALRKWDIETAREFALQVSDAGKRKDIENKISKIEEKIAKLNIIVESLILELSANNIENVKKNIDNNVFNELKLEQLKKIDFSDVEIIAGKPSISKERAVLIVGISYYAEVFYYEIIFELKKDGWKIVDFYEKG